MPMVCAEGPLEEYSHLINGSFPKDVLYWESNLILSQSLMKQDLRIIFLGTAEFAVPSLSALCAEGYSVVAVVTAPDKPAGRGLQLQQSPVKQFALSQNIPVLQPVNLKDPAFIAELKAYHATLQIVVAFRMLPEAIWKMPALGTMNLHASLLPQYRGAAPINHAIMNGETETGVSTFFLKHEIDTGSIIFQEKVSIGESESAGELHDRLMITGSGLVIKTVRAIEDGNYPSIDQASIFPEGTTLKTAPKIFRENCRINFNRSVEEIHNFVRGLSPYPGAYTELGGDQHVLILKVTKAEKESGSGSMSERTPGEVFTDGKTFLKISGDNGYIHLKEIQPAGKKKMSIEEFLRGYKINPGWKVKQYSL